MFGVMDKFNKQVRKVIIMDMMNHIIAIMYEILFDKIEILLKQYKGHHNLLVAFSRNKVTD